MAEHSSAARRARAPPPNDDAYAEVTLHSERVLRSQTNPGLELDPAEVLPAR